MSSSGMVVKKTNKKSLKGFIKEKMLSNTEFKKRVKMKKLLEQQ